VNCDAGTRRAGEPNDRGPPPTAHGLPVHRQPWPEILEGMGECRRGQAVEVSDRLCTGNIDVRGSAYPNYANDSLRDS
jgi:hypothetical protein